MPGINFGAAAERPPSGRPARSGSFDVHLHGLRGVASALVVVFHICAGAVTGNFVPEAAWLRPLIELGLLGEFGVDLFFMISGYLITASVIRHRTAVGFLTDRAVRLYPAFLPALLAIFILGPLANYDYFRGVDAWRWVQLLLANLAFLPGVFPMRPALLVAWSLSFEAVFYLAAAGSTALMRRQRQIGLVVTTVATVAFVIAFPRAAFFLVGVAAYFCREAAAPLLRRTSFALPLVGALFFTMLLFAIGAFSPLPDLAVPVRLACGVVALVAGGWLFFAILDGRSAWLAPLRARPVQFLGSISYSLYLWHSLVMFGTKRAAVALVLPQQGTTATFLVFAVSSVVVSIAISWVSYAMFEQWATSWLRRRLGLSAARAQHPLPASV